MALVYGPRRLPAFKRLAVRDKVPYGTHRPAGAQGRDVLTSDAMHGRDFTMMFASSAALGPRARLGVLLKRKTWLFALADSSRTHGAPPPIELA